ncbi:MULTISPECIES: IS66 family insertion sequence element accessory protein TnpB [unclassified Caballeronia]|uniref:IS66 family insertion sequence element accessory protein TnpB n=1 Tax=unclassified Caballeronia TaxID=2646786 RepID=UPI0032F05B94
MCREPVDMGKSIDTLSYLVEPLLAQKPSSGNLFVFVGRPGRSVKTPRHSKAEVPLLKPYRLRALVHAARTWAFSVAYGVGTARFHARRAQCMA